MPVSHPCGSLPIEFLKKRSQQYIQDTIDSRYKRVKMLYVEGNVEIECPSYAYFVKQKRGLKISIKRIMTLSLRMIQPSFLVKKFGAVISERQMKDITNKWELFLKTGAKRVKYMKTDDLLLRKAQNLRSRSIWEGGKRLHFTLEYGEDIKINRSSQRTVTQRLKSRRRLSGC